MLKNVEIRKAIIPAAGLGTRFLPATKAMPKEMLPIVDKPTIQYIIEEAVESGIEDIIIVTGKGKRSIEDHFDYVPELEKTLECKEKYNLLDEIRRITEMADIHYIRQKEPKGLGHAIWSARKFIGDEPFAVLLGDDIVQANKPAISQMMEIFNKYHSSIIGVKKVDKKDVSRYGIVDVVMIQDRIYTINDLVEKPSIDEAPSNIAIMGRYILTPEIFNILENQEIGAGGEIQLTDAIKRLNEEQAVYAYEFEGKRYDVGEKLGFIQTTIDFALQREDLRQELLKYMEKILEKSYLKK